MEQPANALHTFRLGKTAYRRTTLLSLLMMVGLLLCAVLAVCGCVWLWGKYDHHFTLYLKWQDALIGLLGAISFIGFGGCILIARFLFALHNGYRKSVFTLYEHTLEARDLSPQNLLSIFWSLNAAFWCSVAALIGLLPAVLIGWTLKLSDPMLLVLATGGTILLSIAGLVVSIISVVFIVIGVVGLVSFTQKLGAALHYELDNRAALRIDRSVLTIIYPGKQETMIDLRLLDPEDQCLLLALLRERWQSARKEWNPDLGEEIEQALHEAERKAIPV